MRLAFDLNNGAIASYQWGDLHASFGVFATPTPDVLKQTLASLSVGVASWRTPAEFRSTVSLLHEFAHYMQDVSTGLGHWDYWQRRTHITKILGAARNASWLPDQRAEVSALAEAFFADLIYKPFASLTLAESENLKRRLQTISPSTDITPQMFRDYSLETLLESEAAATTFSQVTPLNMSDDAFETFKQNIQVLDLETMGHTYSAPYRFVEDLLEMPAQFEGLDAANIIIWFLTTFVDIACAHPSPDLLKHTPVDRVDFHPTIKFARLLQAYHDMDAAAGALMQQAVLKRDGAAFEQALLQHCPVSYPTSQAIYEDWLALFQAMGLEDDETVSIRILACQRRLAHPESAAEKTIGSVLTSGDGLPFFCRSAHAGGLGYASLGWRQAFDLEVFSRLTVDMSRNARDLRLVELLTSNVPYRCPIADQGICPAASAECRNGVPHIDALPNDAACMVRSGLTAAGWKFN